MSFRGGNIGVFVKPWTLDIVFSFPHSITYKAFSLLQTKNFKPKEIQKLFPLKSLQLIQSRQFFILVVTQETLNKGGNDKQKNIHTHKNTAFSLSNHSRLLSHIKDKTSRTTKNILSRKIIQLKCKASQIFAS